MNTPQEGMRLGQESSMASDHACCQIKSSFNVFKCYRYRLLQRTSVKRQFHDHHGTRLAGCKLRCPVSTWPSSPDRRKQAIDHTLKIVVGCKLASCIRSPLVGSSLTFDTEGAVLGQLARLHRLWTL